MVTTEVLLGTGWLVSKDSAGCLFRQSTYPTWLLRGATRYHVLHGCLSLVPERHPISRFEMSAFRMTQNAVPSTSAFRNALYQLLGTGDRSLPQISIFFIWAGISLDSQAE